MATREGTFYAPWPVLDGKPLNLQWGEIRSDTAELKALARNSVQDIEDGVEELNALRALLGQAYGDLDFRNKYRFFYNSSTEELCCQKNDGTVDSPEWTDAWCVRFHDGQFQSVSTGGVQSAAGFYGPGLQTISEVAESGTSADVSIKNPSKLFFNADEGLSVQEIASGANAGEPEVRFSAPFGKAERFTKSGRVWEVNHDFGVTPVLVQVMDSGDQIVLPDKADVSDPNTAWFYFNEPFSGSVYIASGGIGASSLVPRDPFYLVARTDDVPAAPGNTLKPNADLIFDSSHFYVNVDLDAEAGGAHKKAYIHLTGGIIDHDHGNLIGLSDDDHTQYTLADGTRRFNGNSVLMRNLANVNNILYIDSGLTTAQQSQIIFQDQSVSKWILTKGASNRFRLYDAVETHDVLRITSHADNEYAIVVGSGNVGIGTATPSKKLHVVGEGYFTAHVRMDDTLNVENIVTAEAFYVVGDGFLSSLRIREADGNPDVSNVNDIIVTNGTLTDNGGGSVTLTTGGGGGGSIDITDGTNTYSAPDVLNFSGDDFYLSGDANGDPVVNLQEIRQLYLDDGSNSAPSLTFDQDRDTGIYRSASNVLAFTVGGGAKFAIYDTYIWANQPLRGNDGNAVSPEYAFSGDSNTGVYNIGADILGVSAGGVERLRVGSTLSKFSTHVRMDDTLNVENAVTAEAFYFHPGSGGGMYQDGDDIVVNSSAGQIILDNDVHVGEDGASGDSVIDFQIGGALQFRIGVDDDDGDSFKIADSTGFGSGDIVKFSQSGHMNIYVPIDSLNVENTVTAEAFYSSSGHEVPQTYVEEFTFAVEWVVNHNLNREHFIAQAFKGNGQLLTPTAVFVNDKNTAYFYFAEAHAGKAVIFGAS